MRAGEGGDVSAISKTTGLPMSWELETFFRTGYIFATSPEAAAKFRRAVTFLESRGIDTGVHLLPEPPK